MLTGKWITGSLVAAGWLAVATAQAAPAERGFYFGANAGQTKFDQDAGEADAIIFDALVSNGFFVLDSDSQFDDSDTTFSGFAGYRFFPYLAVEAGYVDLGELSYDSSALVTGNGFGPQVVRTRLTASSKGAVVSALGIWPVSDVLELYGRAGFLFSDTEISATAQILSISDTQSDSSSAVDAMVGLGAAVNVGRTWTFRLEYQRFGAVGDEDTTGETDIDSYHLGVVIRL